MHQIIIQQPEFIELATEILQRGGCLRFKVRGISMCPSIKNGDVVTVQPVNNVSLKVNDVIFYHAANGKVAVHRIIGKPAQSALLVRGDAHRGPSERVFTKQLLGKVIHLEHSQQHNWIYRIFERFVRNASRSHRLLRFRCDL